MARTHTPRARRNSRVFGLQAEPLHERTKGSFALACYKRDGRWRKEITARPGCFSTGKTENLDEMRASGRFRRALPRTRVPANPCAAASLRATISGTEPHRAADR